MSNVCVVEGDEVWVEEGSDRGVERLQWFVRHVELEKWDLFFMCCLNGSESEGEAENLVIERKWVFLRWWAGEVWTWTVGQQLRGVTWSFICCLRLFIAPLMG